MRIAHSNRTDLATIYAHMRKLGVNSGRARVRYDLEGSSLVGPLGATMIPLMRTGLVLYRAATQEPAELGYVARKLDKIFVGMSHFAIGFFRGSREATRAKEPQT